MLRGFANEGRTVVVASHVLSEIAQTADHAVIVSAGQVRFAGPPDEIGAANRLESAFLKLTVSPKGPRRRAERPDSPAPERVPTPGAQGRPPAHVPPPRPD